MDYRGARFYDSDIGRFLSVDPLAADFASWSPYNYVLGNPIMLIDPDGRAPIVWPPPWLFPAAKAVVTNYFSPGTEYKGSAAEGGFKIAGVDPKAPTMKAEGNASLLGGKVYNKSSDTNISVGGEGSYLAADAKLQVGGDALAVHGEAKGSLLSSKVNLDVGVLNNEDDKSSIKLDANAGAYIAEGEIGGGGSILGFKWTFTAGASFLSPNAGITIGGTFDNKTGKILVEGVQHLGLIVGTKSSLKVEIPTTLDGMLGINKEK